MCTYTADLDATLPPIAAAVSTGSPTMRPSLDDVETERPSQRLSQTPSYQPSSLVAEEVEEDQDFLHTAEEDNSEDWSQLVVDDEEEDWSQVEETIQNLWCGTSQFDAIRNCGAGMRCDTGICPGTLKCFAVPGTCVIVVVMTPMKQKMEQTLRLHRCQPLILTKRRAYQKLTMMAQLRHLQ